MRNVPQFIRYQLLLPTRVGITVCIEISGGTMSGIDFKQKISFQRPFGKSSSAEDEYEITRYLKAIGRIVNLPPFGVYSKNTGISARAQCRRP